MSRERDVLFPMSRRYRGNILLYGMCNVVEETPQAPRTEPYRVEEDRSKNVGLSNRGGLESVEEVDQGVRRRVSRLRQGEREDESEARKQARHDVEAAAYCYYADQKAAKAAKVAKAVKGVKAGEAVEAAQAPKDVKVVKVPKADKAVQVRLPSDAAPAPVQKAAVFTAPESVPSVSTETTRVPSASSASVVSAPDTLTTTEKEANDVSAKPSNGEMVVSGLAESVAKMRCHIGMLSTKYPGVSPQITSAAAGGLKRILDNMDLVILALRSHVQ